MKLCHACSHLWDLGHCLGLAADCHCATICPVCDKPIVYEATFGAAHRRCVERLLKSTRT